MAEDDGLDSSTIQSFNLHSIRSHLTLTHTSRTFKGTFCKDYTISLSFLWYFCEMMIHQKCLIGKECKNRGF